MRIQLCKERYMAVDEFRNDLDKIRNEIDPYWNRDYIRPWFYIDTGEAVAEAYICASCGTEYFRHYCCYGELVVKDNRHNCYTPKGQELLEKTSNRIKSRKQQVMLDFKKSTLPEICPVCGMSLQDELYGKAQNKWGYNLVSSGKGPLLNWDEKLFNSLIDSAFRDLEYKLKKERENQVKKELAKLELYHSEPIDIISSSKCQAIQSNKKQLSTYIYTLLQLDSNIKSLKNRLSSLYAARIENQIEVNIINSEPLVEIKKKMDEDMVIFSAAQEEYNKCITVAKSRKCNKPKLIDIPMPSKPIAPEYKKPGLLNKKKVLAMNAESEARYQLEMQEYEHKCQSRLEEIERKNNSAQTAYLANVKEAEDAVQSAKAKMDELRVIPEKYVPAAPIEACPEKARQAMIVEEIEKAETLLKQLIRTENEMYAANIIYQKYWNVHILSAFYDYLMSGRCTSLEGEKGAYNLYENESRSNVMIKKLSGIEKSLARIERGQNRISAQLSDMNASLQRLNDTMDAACSTLSGIRISSENMTEYLHHISQNSDVIAYNTAATAYYSKINADLTNALGFMVALK